MPDISAGDFDWDDANLNHVAEHDIDFEEAEEALLDPRRIPAPAYRGADGERRRGTLGMTVDGRLLFVAFATRGPLVRVITARDATAREKRRYESRGK